MRFFVLAFIAGGSVVWAQSADIVVGRLVNNMSVRNAQKFIESDQSRIARETADLEKDSDPRRFAGLLKENGMGDAHVDAAGNAAGSNGMGDGPVLVLAAHLKDARALAVLLAAVRGIRSQGIRLKSELMLVGLADRHAAGKTSATDSLFLESDWRSRIRNFVVVETREAEYLAMAPKTIGTTIVQSALEVMMSLGLKPQYEENLSDRETALALKIPSIAIGCGYSSAVGVQSVMTTALAIAGI